MTEKCYGDLRKEELILRDHLAIYRTVLANERTLLSYVRTAMAMLVLGFTFLQFLHDPITTVVGWMAVVGGGALLLVGVLRFRRMQRRIGITREQGPPHTRAK